MSDEPITKVVTLLLTDSEWEAYCKPEFPFGVASYWRKVIFTWCASMQHTGNKVLVDDLRELARIQRIQAEAIVEAADAR